MSPQIDTKVLRAELEDIEHRRNLVFRPGQPPRTELPGQPSPDLSADPDADPETRLTQLDALFTRSHRLRPLGIALSGRSIRSVRFNLGVLQGLAAKGLLHYVDYLSTVSGGGYIGSWLHGMIRNRCRGDVRSAETFLATTGLVPSAAELDPVRFLVEQCDRLSPRPSLFSTESWVIESIRSRDVLLNQLILVPTLCALILLALFVGFLSQTPVSSRWADMESVLAFALLSVATVIAALNLRLNVRPSQMPRSLAIDWLRTSTSSGRLAALTLFIAALLIAVKGQPERAAMLAAAEQFAARWGGVPSIPLESEAVRTMSLAAVPLLLFAFQVIGGFPSNYRRLRQRPDGSIPTAAAVLSYVHVMWMTAIASGVTAGLIYITVANLPLATASFGAASWFRVVVGPPAVSACLLVGTALLVGLMGAEYPAGAREWLARIGSLILQFSLGWCALLFVAVAGPYLVTWLLLNNVSIAASALGGWALTAAHTFFFALTGRGKDAKENQAASVLRKIIAITPDVSMIVFVIGYLLILSTLVHVALGRLTPAPEWQPRPDTAAQPAATLGPETKGTSTANKGEAVAKDLLYDACRQVLRAFQANYWQVLSPTEWALYRPGPTLNNGPGGTIADIIRRSAARTTLALSLLCLAIGGIASWRFNINELSLDRFYRDRLVRCYLGASSTSAQVREPLTGDDMDPDFPISALVPDARVEPYTGPYAIVNAALNLSVGSDLAPQPRKSISFVFTPRFCGYQSPVTRERNMAVQRDALDPSGYRDTSDHTGSDGFGFMFPQGPGLGTAMAISGAPANPNESQYTTGTMASLLAMFNGRLGWWVGNPSNPRTLVPRLVERVRVSMGLTGIVPSPIMTSRTPGPRSVWDYLFAKLKGQTTTRSRYVNLSDGGDFEKLGLYELVRRRCRYIIVSDAEREERETFEGLAGAIRRCRADFGVEIDIDPSSVARDSHNISGAHCVIGTIRYPEAEPGSSPGLHEGDFAPSSGTPARGWLLYLKSSLTGDEPTDVLERAAVSEPIVEDGPRDQSAFESQVDSDRRLGLHVVNDAFEDIEWPPPQGSPASRDEGEDLRSLFQQLTQRFYPAVPVNRDEAMGLARAYMSFIQRVGARTQAGLLERQLLPTIDRRPESESECMTAVTPDEIVLGVEAVQLMEDVFVAFGLNRSANRINPRSAGWMTILRQWADPQSVLITQIWPRVRQSYGPIFRRFVERDLTHHAAGDWPERP
jgi:hypothetical protein